MSLEQLYYTQSLSKSQYSKYEYDTIYPHKISISVGESVNYRERMRELREDNDLTQSQVAKILNKSQQGYNHIEMGRAELKIEDLIKLCDFYKVSADYFIGRKEK